MTSAYSVLGQAAPSATTATDLYTVPSSTQAVTSGLVVCNRGASSATFRVSIRPAGATQADKHYLVKDASLAANQPLFLPGGWTLEATDVVTVYASSADLSFTLTGVEITA